MMSKWLVIFIPLDGDGRLTGADATKFFSMSNLSRQDLKQVWAIADSKRQGYLGLKEFITAMQIVSLAQSGRGITSDLVASEDVDFENLQPPTMEGLDVLLAAAGDKESWDMNTEEKIEAAGKKKEEGNVLFKAGKYVRASKRYEKAAKYIEYDTSFSEDEKKQSKALKVTCNLNNAACKLKLKDYKETVKLCTKVLELESTNVKALYIKKALEIDPDNRDVKLGYKTLKEKVKEFNKKDAKFYGNMFAKLNFSDYLQRVDLIQNLGFETATSRIRVSPDGEYVIASGIYPPQVKVYELRELSLKFERHLISEIINFQDLHSNSHRKVLEMRRKKETLENEI
ncbi:hypothetical protein CASFOL_022102 [Castilleja foliolosa]|uniref:Uncharacterized protein n=2 Tax=Castilleja foliolosa TaxID=1961234 RepID=A0ABD3CYG9_9LAMI